MRIAFAALSVFATLVLSPAYAATTCTLEPEPELATQAEFDAMDLATAKAASKSAFADVKQFQTGANVYRECLNREIAALETKIKADKDAKASDKAELAKLVQLHDASIDTETKLATSFNGMLDSLCKRGDKPSC